MAENNNNRDLVLAPGEYAYVLDTTKGLVNVNVGPYKNSMSNTDQPVIFDRQALRFTRVELEQAVQRDLVAPEGFYLALYNPALREDTEHPISGKSSSSVDLNVGHRVNTPGPAHFALWPGQFAEAIRGHHLRSNQYLLAQVYNDQAATSNWKDAVLKPAAPVTPTPGTSQQPPQVPAPRTFTPGQLMVIQGTDVAFFIPPTGIKVVPDENGSYVREAVTLERLQYCILLDEDGNKRFVQGPAVVFPAPTEKFIDKDGSRAFQAIELNETTGIYIKVIADYEENGHQFKAGDELFITGKEQAIYYQREEHSVIRYGQQTKHYAVAVPAGEGRYVLDRRTGEIRLARGPQMLLCDPRSEVIVRRILAQKTASLWYPNNDAVLQVNQQLEATSKATQSAPGLASAFEAGRTGTTPTLGNTSNYMALAASEDKAIAASRQIAGDVFNRGTSFTPPRTLTLDTKYEGAVSINIWTGYAVMVTNKTGKRRVVVGPETVLLEYDETLAPLSLSTGRPKSHAKRFDTVYLRVANNAITDIVKAETKDLVPVKLTVAYRVNFEGTDLLKWFAVEDYIGLLCDHMRSLIRNVAKRKGIEEFYGNPIDIIRDATLGVVQEAGKPRSGRRFDENNMRAYDVEVLDVTIDNPGVAALLGQAQLNSLKSAIQISEEERQLATAKRSDDLKRQAATLRAETVEHVNANTRREVEATLKLESARLDASALLETTRLEQRLADQERLNQLNAGELDRQKATDAARLATKTAEIDLELKRIVGETTEIVKRAEAVDDGLAVALTAFSDQQLIEKISVALAPMAMMNGVSAADVLAQLFAGTPFEGVMHTLGTRSRVPVLAGGGKDK